MLKKLEIGDVEAAEGCKFEAYCMTLPKATFIVKCYAAFQTPSCLVCVCGRVLTILWCASSLAMRVRLLARLCMFVCALMLHTPSTFNTFDIIIFSILSLLGLVLSSRWKFYLWAVLNTSRCLLNLLTGTCWSQHWVATFSST